VSDDAASHFVPVGRPVRTFVLVLSAVALLLIAVWWTGLAWPRLGWDGGSFGQFDTRSNRGTSTVTVRNAGPLVVELVGAGVRAVGPRAFSATDDSFDRVRLAAGESREVTVSYRAERCAHDPVIVWFSVRTPSGVVRTVSHGGPIQNPVPMCTEVPPG
jgi:hypothetical protein